MEEDFRQEDYKKSINPAAVKEPEEPEPNGEVHLSRRSFLQGCLSSVLLLLFFNDGCWLGCLNFPLLTLTHFDAALLREFAAAVSVSLKASRCELSADKTARFQMSFKKMFLMLEI